MGKASSVVTHELDNVPGRVCYTLQIASVIVDVLSDVRDIGTGSIFSG
jgi:hypothetical protein